MTDINYKTSSTQIAKNSIFLYLRQLLIMVVGLITVRVTLRTLGAEDYGVYNVVAGSVTLFSFLMGAVSMGAQRYFSYYIGKGDLLGLKKVFSLTFTIYVVLSVLVFILTEALGIYLLENELVIPESRMSAARIVFQFACISLCFNILQAPFMASVIAHENMKVFAQLGLYDATAKLLLVFLLTILPFDKLVLYGFLYMLVVASCTLFYQVYTCKNYQECSLKLLWDKVMVKELLKYNGWNLWGQLAGVMKTQGIAIILNTFFGPIINAALQVANQVRGVCVTLSQNFSAAVNPQIIKSYSAKDLERMFVLSFASAKLNYMLTLAIILPMTFHVEYLLSLWLGDIPDWTITICRLLFIDSLIEVASSPFATINQATGKIGLYQFVLGSVGLLNIPFAYIALNINAEPSQVFIIGIILQVVVALIRALFINRVKNKMIFRVIRYVYLPCSLLFLICIGLSHLCVTPANNLFTICLYSFLQVALVLFLSYILLFNKIEKNILRNMLFVKFIKK